MIHISNLGKTFKNRILWSRLNITVNSGQKAVLIGANGSGKTTLLNCLSLLDHPTEGRITYNKTEVTALNRGAKRRYRRDHIGYLLQGLALIEDGTVKENLSLARSTQSTRRDHLIRQQEALERVGLKGIEKEKIYRLSGGEQQRVALAQLLIKKPSIVLLDEPTAALDEINISMVTDIINNLARDGAAIITATHDNHIRKHADVEYRLGTYVACHDHETS